MTAKKADSQLIDTRGSYCRPILINCTGGFAGCSLLRRRGIAAAETGLPVSQFKQGV
jgi:hypothetical protein